MQPSLDFDGETFDGRRDGARLTGQLERVRRVMSDGLWRTLQDIAREAGGSEAGVSARLRDLRKPKFGGLEVERRHYSGGTWVYRVPQMGLKASPPGRL